MAIEEESQQQEPKRIEYLKDPQSVPILLLEIVFEILLRLPIQSLLQCRFVCKSWYSLISDSLFVKSHLSLSTNNNRYVHQRLISCPSPRKILKSCSLYNVIYDMPVHLLELDCPFKHTNDPVCLIDSCNGLLCIKVGMANLFIWNPSTRRSNKLPYCAFKPSRWFENLKYGFGYDESTDDYKVVAVSNNDYTTVIYSLRSGIWKNIGDISHSIDIWKLGGSGKFLNGAIHWAAIDASSDSWTIVSLDLAKETYGKVLQPQPVYDEVNKHLTLGVLGELLCVVCNSYEDCSATVWVMKVYGVEDSWIKLVSIHDLFNTSPGDPYLLWRSLGITDEGKILLQHGQDLVLYDPKNDSFLKVNKDVERFEAYTFVESLVSPFAP